MKANKEWNMNMIFIHQI